jgi:hypothetical protein
MALLLRAALLTLTVVVLPASAEAATSISFTTPGCSVWPVPAGVAGARVAAVGAAGASTDKPGGTGDGVTATVSGLGSGTTLDVCVDYNAAVVLAPARGGGASGVSLGSDFSSPLLVAGGGGGSGTSFFGSGSGAGGNAGLPAGVAGGNANTFGLGYAHGGKGGNDSTMRPGAAGTGDLFNGNAGARFDAQGPGVGGDGGFILGGGGGGAGYFGGGGGGTSVGREGAGGGGGSDWCRNSRVLGVSACSVHVGAGTQTVAGTGPGDASVVLTLLDATRTDVSCTAAPTATCTATVTDLAGTPTAPTGTVTFGPLLTPSCRLTPTGAAGVARCTARVVGSRGQLIRASYSGDSGHAPSSGTARLG